MRTLAPLVVLGMIGAAPLALAEAWRAKPALEPGAPLDCKEADVSNLFFEFADTGNEPSVKTSSGEAFSAPISPDGSLKTTFKLPVGGKTLAADLTGNVKTREMEVFNERDSCRFKLAPVQ
jgi:hypothetical protein